MSDQDRQEVPKRKKKVKKKRVVDKPVEPDIDLPAEPTTAPATSVGGIDSFLDMPELPGDEEHVVAKETVIKDAFDYDVACRFGFIGIGQGGSRLARAFYELGYRRVVVIDGAHQDLLDVPKEIPRLDLETSGSAKDIQTGENSVAGRDEEIWELISTGIGADVDYILVCACLGGGTGSGAVHKIIDVARNFTKEKTDVDRVGCIVSLPMKAEGQRVASNAVETFRRLWESQPAPLIVIDNQRIGELFPVGVAKIYGQCNKQTAGLFHLFNQLAAQRSQLVTFDRAEFVSLLDKGLVVFGASPIKPALSKSDVAKAIRKHLEDTALAKVDASTAEAAGCIFLASEQTFDELSMDVLDGGFDMLNRTLKEGSVVHRGVYFGSQDVLRCFTLLAGLDPPKDRLSELGGVGGLPRTSVAEYFGVDDAS